MVIKRCGGKPKACNGKVRKRRISKRESWNRLPYLSLVEIIKQLPDSDRMSASQVSSGWNTAFQNPSLWRSRRFEFGGSRAKAAERKAIKFAERLGSHLEEVRIDCRHITSSTCEIIASTFIPFAQNMQRSNLKTLKIVDLELDRFWKFPHLRDMVANALSQLLEQQRNLQIFKMTYAQFGLLPGTDVLEKLSQACGNKLHKLLIEDFFHSRLAVFQLERFKSAIQGFTNLQQVALNYCCLSEHLVAFWAQELRGKLKTIRIKACENEPHTHAISGETWKRLSLACPDLSVDFSIMGIGSSDTVTPILAPCIPLCCLHFWSGYDADVSLGLNMTLNHIANNYCSCIEHLHLDLENFHDNIDDALINIVSTCRQLRVLRLKANMSAQVAGQICQLITEGQSKLTSVDITLLDATETDQERLSDLREDMNSFTIERGIYLALHDNLY